MNEYTIDMRRLHATEMDIQEVVEQLDKRRWQEGIDWMHEWKAYKATGKVVDSWYCNDKGKGLIENLCRIAISIARQVSKWRSSAALYARTRANQTHVRHLCFRVLHIYMVWPLQMSLIPFLVKGKLIQWILRNIRYVGNACRHGVASQVFVKPTASSSCISLTSVYLILNSELL